jgi:hypothetical protein
MHSVVEKFLSFLNTKLDGFGKALSLDQMFQLQAAQRQIVGADVADFVVAKRNSLTFTANKEGWQYNKVGADLAEFVSDAVEFMLVVSFNYCVRCAEQRVRAIWKSLPLSWQTQPIYGILYKFKERDDANLRSNLEVAMKNAKTNPAAFLECCLKSDSGAVNRRKDEAAERALIEAQVRAHEIETLKAKTDSEFAVLTAEPDYMERFGECVKWYRSKYKKSLIDIREYPQAVNGYLMNLKERGDYEAFKCNDDQAAGEAKELDYALLDNE